MKDKEFRMSAKTLILPFFLYFCAVYSDAGTNIIPKRMKQHTIFHRLKTVENWLC